MRSYCRPTLLNDLFDMINTQMAARYGAGISHPPSIIPLRRALDVLNQVIKEFTSMKMLGGVNTTASVCLMSLCCPRPNLRYESFRSLNNTT